MKRASEILYQARKSKGLILRKVAAATDIDQSLISKFEQGERLPTDLQIEKLCTFYGIPKETVLIDVMADKVYSQISEYSCASEILQVAESRVTYNTEKND